MVALTPNLFLVGFQKCGSSSLFDLLVQHPEISGCRPKETFALVDEGKVNYHWEKNIKNPNFNWDIFFAPTPAKYRIEASVCNFYQETALDYIAGLPEKKVLFILRDPIERFYSTYEYFFPLITSMPIDSFSKYFEVVLDDKEKIDFEGAKYALEHGKYLKYIQQWERKIGAENILLVSFGQLINSTDQCMREITEFLGISSLSESLVLDKKNKTKKIKYKKLDFYTRKIMGGTGLGASFLGRIYQRMNQTKRKSPINEKYRQKLEVVYKEEYKNLKEYL